MGIVGATKYYGPVQALKGVNLTIRRGQVHAVVGENGAGKSTLIGIAAGAVRPDFAVLRVAGKEIKRPNARKLHRAGVAVTFQHPELAEDMTVMENIQLAAPQLTGRGGRAEAQRLLASVGSEQHFMSLDARVRDLTLAQQHIIEIAGAIASKPKVLFLDEPTEPFQQADVDKLFAAHQAVARGRCSDRLCFAPAARNRTACRPRNRAARWPIHRQPPGGADHDGRNHQHDRGPPPRSGVSPQVAKAEASSSLRSRIFRRTASRTSIFPPTPARSSA